MIKHIDKIFPKINNVNMRKLKIDNEAITYITIPCDTNKIVNIINKHLQKSNLLPKTTTIIDAFAGQEEIQYHLV